MMHVLQHVAVLVPARDEESLLPRCLRSLQRARAELPAHMTSDVVVVSDGSVDRTYAIAAEILGDSGLVVAIAAGRVGVARSVAGTLAASRFEGPASHCWLANTDADGEVPSTWLRDQVDLASRGVHGVTGVIDVDDFGEHEPHVPRRFRATYTINADGTHPHVHGANLGVRLDAYLRAGGWAPLAHSEDHDLWRRLRERGAALVADASLIVRTSGRRVGRAPCGFADALAAHNETRASER
jgi:hypothetical protein